MILQYIHNKIVCNILNKKDKEKDKRIAFLFCFVYFFFVVVVLFLLYLLYMKGFSCVCIKVHYSCHRIEFTRKDMYTIKIKY